MPAVRGLGGRWAPNCGGGALFEEMELREMAERMLLIEERRSDADAAVAMAVGRDTAVGCGK